MAYTKSRADWADGAAGGTPITEVQLDTIETGIFDAAATADAAVPKSLVTTAGDLVYATASAVLARLGIGSAKQVLQTNAGATAPEWSSTLDAVARTDVRKNSAGSVFSRRRLNLIEGSNVTLTVADDSGNEEVDVTITAASSGPTLVTALPGSPVDGDLIIFTDSLTAPTYRWHLQYESTDAKWHFLGGAALFAEVATAQASSGAAAYEALATAGPSITLPLAGDYDVEIGFQKTDALANTIRMSYDIGASAAVDGDAARAASSQDSVHRAQRKTGLTAVALTAKYKDDTAAQTVQNRWMRVTPVKIG